MDKQIFYCNIHATGIKRCNWYVSLAQMTSYFVLLIWSLSIFIYYYFCIYNTIYGVICLIFMYLWFSVDWTITIFHAPLMNEFSLNFSFLFSFYLKLPFLRPLCPLTCNPLFTSFVIFFFFFFFFPAPQLLGLQSKQGKIKSPDHHPLCSHALVSRTYPFYKCLHIVRLSVGFHIFLTDLSFYSS